MSEVRTPFGDDEREQGYAFLAWLFLEGPDLDFLQRLLDADPPLPAGKAVDGKVAAGLEEMRSWLAARSDVPLPQLLQQLRVEGTRLFRGIAPGYGPPPPYETLYRRSRAGSDANILLRIRDRYREAAAELSAGSRERMDHVGMELEFMRFLCGEERRLRLAREDEGALQYRRMERRFLTEHLMTWVPEYCRRILDEPCAPFFHGMLRVLSAFLASDAEWLERPEAASVR